MTSISLPGQGRAKFAVGMLVLGVHLGGIVAWWTLGYVPYTRSSGALAPLTVWLPQLVQPTVEQLAPPTAPKVPRQRDEIRSGLEERGPTNDPVLQSSSAPTADSVAAQESFPSTPILNLTLPRKALPPTAAPAGPAALSPFHGRLPATVAQLIANAAVDAGPWIEERIDDDHFRLRRGNTCIVLERPEAAAIDPFSDAARRLPWRANGLCVP